MSTYTPISSFTATTSISSVTIDNIPQTYTDLVVVCSMQSTAADETDTRHYLKVGNGSISSTGYSVTILNGSGSSATSYRETNRAQFDNIVTVSASSTGEFTPVIYQLQNFSNATTYKTVLYRAGQTTNSQFPSGVSAAVGLWRNTSAINTVEIGIMTNGQIASGSTFNLYGIDAQASAQAKATGGSSIYTDGSYWYHIFNSSGTFTPTENLTADYLVVAGGGGGGRGAYGNGGGGGAGGLRSTVTATGGGGTLESALSLTAQAYTVTIGAGGTGGGGTENSGLSGNNSVFSTITSTAGGGGGGASLNSPQKDGKTGGSGGGGGGTTSVSATGGTGTANQGYAGGNAPAGSPGAGGGGGGGANAVGAVGNGGNAGAGGAGGAGVATSISGSSVTYAGGGGGSSEAGSGGAGGAGGGGAGASGSGGVGANGTTNLGGGGGSGHGTQGNGGSGIVIIRYAV